MSRYANDPAQGQQAGPRLQALTKAGFGLPAGELRLSPPDPRWKRSFSSEAFFLYDALRIEDLRLHHIGSSAIPGIWSKPILDILISVPALRLLDERRAVFEELGYQFKGEGGIAGRRFCVLSNLDAGVDYVHLHCFEEADSQINRHLNFRDYLRLDASAAARYQTAKAELIEGGAGRAEYPAMKSGIILQLQAEADQKAASPQKIVAIASSAPGGRNTEVFLNEFLALHTDVTVFNLEREVVSPYSYGKRPSDDSHRAIVAAMVQSDLIYVATPVYWYSMSGPMKDFMDRFSDLMTGELKQFGETLYGKKLKLIVTGYGERLPLGFEVPFAGMALYFGMDYLGAHYRSVSSVPS